MTLRINSEAPDFTAANGRPASCSSWPLSLRVFGCLPDTDAWGCTEAGVRKASREETAGRVRTGGGASLWRFSAVFDRICHFGTGTAGERVSQPWF
jgi:hypothetical protein